MVQLKISKARATETSQPQSEHRDGLWREPPSVRLLKAGRRHLNGPQGNRITGPEATRCPTYWLRVEHGIAWNEMPTRELSLLCIEDKLHDRHGGNRCQVVRVEDAQEGVGEFRKLVVDLMMHPCCQESKSLQQALDMGVLTFARFQQ